MAYLEAAQRYFEARAAFYDQLSERGLWARVRRREAAAVQRLLGPVICVPVLDLGCGAGFYAERIRARGGLPFGVDASPAMIAELAKKGIPGTRANVANLRLGDRKSTRLNSSHT